MKKIKKFHIKKNLQFPIKIDFLNFIWFNYADGCNLFGRETRMNMIKFA